MNQDWRESEKANELRDYIDRNFKPRKIGMKNLDREIVIDFVAKEISAALLSSKQNPSSPPNEL